METKKDISIVAFLLNYLQCQMCLDEYEILMFKKTKISTLVGAKGKCCFIVDFSYPNPRNDFTNVTLNLKKSC